MQMLTNALSVTSLLLLRTEGLGEVGAITIDKEGRMSTKETGAGKGNPEVNMQNAIFEKDSSKLHFCLKSVWTPFAIQSSCAQTGSLRNFAANFHESLATAK